MPCSGVPNASMSSSKRHQTVRRVLCSPQPQTPSSLKIHHNVELARCYLRLANLPNFALDRLSRYEAILWRQAGQILFALDALDRRKPQDRGRHFRNGSRQELPIDGRDA